MNELRARILVVEALHEVTGALSTPDLALRLNDSNTNVLIAELGLDSLSAVEWCMEIETRSGIDLDPAELTTHGSLDELVRLIVGRAGSAEREPRLVRVSR